jgi:hypothetical protein
MKKILIGLLAMASISASAGIVESTISMVETQYNLKCGEAKQMKQKFFKPLRHREEIECNDGSKVPQVAIQTEAKAKGQPIYKIQVLSANPGFKL